MSLFSKNRSREEIVEQLRKLNHSAKRMTVKHPEYGNVHSMMNELLDELEK